METLAEFPANRTSTSEHLKHKRIVRNSAETVRFHKIPVFFAVNFTT